MTHPRLSVSEMSTYPWTFGDELSLWEELELEHAGLMMQKLAVHGLESALAALEERAIRSTSVIAGGFDLSEPASWTSTRTGIDSAVDVALATGGTCVYITPGRRVSHRSFAELTDALGEAVAPCLDRAGALGVRIALEPSLRTDVSFVHTLRDAIDVSDSTGLAMVADIGNCWMERDVEQTLERAGDRIAVVQLSDAAYGVPERPPMSGRWVVGDGDLSVSGFIEAALGAGYLGCFEIEQVGPQIEAEGHEAALRRSVERLSALLDVIIP